AERLAARGPLERDGQPLAVVASHPYGPSWPPRADPALRHRVVRRVAATAIALAGLLDLVSAVTPPLRGRLNPLLDVVPLGLSQVAAAAGALAGLGLLALARGVRRGQRQAWVVSVVLLATTVLFQLLKDNDLPAVAAAAAVLAYLLRHQRSFRAGVDRPSLSRGVAGLLAGAAGVTLLASVAVELTLMASPHHRALAPLPLLSAVVDRLVGITSVPLPRRIDRFLSPSLLTIGVALAAWALYLAFRPVVERRGTNVDLRAREVVLRHGAGTLDYFALRDDKRFFFFGSTLVAYANWGGVCLVSPDPVGPEAEREAAWSAFRRFADRQGWALGVLGAGEEWLPIYRTSGMHELYVGDEAVVTLQSFTLEGGAHKSLRQAVNRIARHGYTLSFHDPAHLDRGLAAELRQLMGRSRRGEAERGFSMTLGRVFDPADKGLLLAVAHDSQGRAVAFCQYVPATGIDGYSLDLMRRDGGDHPNGLLDFVVVGTISHLREAGHLGLGLNFATMRAVLAGEAGDNLPQRVERWVLRRMSGSMQIESLWRFNSKYDPRWQPRFVVYDSPENVLALAMAIARAESFWELPLLGRFLVPPAARTPSVPGAKQAG
ncbi:MAG: bifunctional lysylphosphatidylglycerol flippase/synthetase MprF, partial [Acidimicrobiales bacterium]